MRKMLLIISLLVVQNSLADSMTDNSGTDISRVEMSSARQDELLYLLKHDCGSCHGMTLKGGLGPALLPQTLAAQPRDYIVTTIMQGRKDTAMPGWSSMLTQSEAAWLAEQLQNGLVPQTEIAEGKTK
jgi:cytochrome c55X